MWRVRSSPVGTGAGAEPGKSPAPEGNARSTLRLGTSHFPEPALARPPRLGQRDIEGRERLRVGPPDRQRGRERGTLLAAAEPKAAPQEIDRRLTGDVLVPVAGVRPGGEKSHHDA